MIEKEENDERNKERDMPICDSAISTKIEQNSFIEEKKTTQTVRDTRKENDSKGSPMTMWWLYLSFTVAVFSLGYEYVGDNKFRNLIHGTCALSGLCVGIGYYTFMVLFNFVQEPSLCRQFYDKSWKAKGFSFYSYVLIDTFVHLGCTSGLFYIWYDYINLLSALVCFAFHRLWSLVHSNWKTIYFHGDIVYEFQKPMPKWSWCVVYGVESLICLAFIIFSVKGKSV